MESEEIRFNVEMHSDMKISSELRRGNWWSLTWNIILSMVRIGRESYHRRRENSLGRLEIKSLLPEVPTMITRMRSL